MIRGVTIKLKVRTENGTDEFNQPIYSDSWVDVDNVLIGEPSSNDVASALNLYGKRLAFTLAIPKGDDHDWVNTEVRFFGRIFRTVGEPVQGIEELIPLSWNKKVQVETYGFESEDQA